MIPEPNDPTRSGSPIPADSGARLSQSEIEALCLKAARGAGMSWGLAEEAGFAAAWLAARGLDGPSVLLMLLHSGAGRQWADIRPVVAEGAWSAPDDSILCPVALGTALCDFAALPQGAMGDAPLRVGPVSHAALLLPFFAALAKAQGGTVTLDWLGGKVAVASDGAVSGDVAALEHADSITGELSRRPGLNCRGASAPDRLVVPAETLKGLNTLALRTTVPASEASRAGAGAATADND